MRLMLVCLVVVLTAGPVAAQKTEKELLKDATEKVASLQAEKTTGQTTLDGVIKINDQILAAAKNIAVWKAGDKTKFDDNADAIASKIVRVKANLTAIGVVVDVAEGILDKYAAGTLDLTIHTAAEWLSGAIGLMDLCNEGDVKGLQSNTIVLQFSVAANLLILISNLPPMCPPPPP